jgi:hypothetical protein
MPSEVRIAQTCSRWTLPWLAIWAWITPASTSYTGPAKVRRMSLRSSAGEVSK